MCVFNRALSDGSGSTIASAQKHHYASVRACAHSCCGFCHPWPSGGGLSSIYPLLTPCFSTARVGSGALRGPGLNRLQSMPLGISTLLRPNSWDRMSCTAVDTPARTQGRCMTMWNSWSCLR